MKKIAVYFSRPGIEEYPFDKDYYRTAYKELAQKIEKRGGKLYVVRGQSTYMGGNRFSKAWAFDSEWFSPIDGPLDADVIYVKAAFEHDEQATLLNDPSMNNLCIDKWKTYQLFPELFPQTFIAHSDADIEHALSNIHTDMVVVKPIDGEEGRGVHVVPKSEVAQHITHFPYLLQSFIDTSGGVHDLIKGLHDFRITSINGQPVLAFIRTPPTGSYTANIAQGGIKIEVPLDQIPPEASAIWERVDAEFSRFKRRVYSVDMGRDRDGSWKIIELNAMPGCTCASEGPLSEQFQEKLAEALLS